MPATEASLPPMAAIIMAAGRGTRMQAKSLPKVCFPVLGVPAINRSIRGYRGCGIETIVVVVGADGDQVMETVSSEHEGVLYAHQPEARGTGNAVRVGFGPLRRMGFDGLVWCIVGDKIVEREALRQVLKAFADPDVDAAFAVTDKPRMKDMGRVLQDAEGRVRGIFERNDLRAAALTAELDAELRRGQVPSAKSLRQRCAEAVGSPDRCKRIFGKVWRLAESGRRFSSSRLRAALPAKPGLLRAGKGWVSAEHVLKHVRLRNESVYCFRASTLDRVLRRTPPPRGRREDYITDILGGMFHPRTGKPARVEAVFIEDRSLIMGFNTPEQLLSIEDAIRKREPATVSVPTRALRLSRAQYKSAAEWMRLIRTMPPRFRKALAAIYGDDADVVDGRRDALLRTARLFARRHGKDRKAVIVRAPGGVNLMGRHVDEFGGYVNVMSIDREVLFMAAPREDDVVHVTQADGRTPADVQFSVTREIGALGWDDWLNFISSAKVRQMISATRSDWSMPVRAAVLRLQQQFRSRRLHGMDAVVFNDIPMAAGLGASSALMVAASEAYLALNNIGVTPEEVVELCGEGQRFLGRSGPPARHAAAMLGKRGQVMRMRFDPFEVDRLAAWPKGVRLALCRTSPDARSRIPPEHRQQLSSAM